MLCNVGALIYGGKVVRQPGDGSCLFHSISYGLRDGSDANSLRAEICQFIQRNPEYKISETPLSDWVKVCVCYILYIVFTIHDVYYIIFFWWNHLIYTYYISCMYVYVVG